MKPRLRKGFELMQNEATRVIQDAARWTKVTNLLKEANLFPLDSQIDLMARLCSLLWTHS